MAEFTVLPFVGGELVSRAAYNEILNAVNSRRAVVFPDATAAFTIYNGSGDATSATVEIDTVANEIYLIVVDGTNASNNTLDLNAAANDTIAELVAAINALGKGWVAVEKSGAQSSAIGNTSERLRSSGPANVLSSAAITWFTNYAPNGVHVGSLIGNINAYREAVDNLSNKFEMDTSIGFKGSDGVTASADNSLQDTGAFAGFDFTGVVFNVHKTTGGTIGNYTVASNDDNKLIFTTDPGNGSDVFYHSMPTSYSVAALHAAAFGRDTWEYAGGEPNLNPICLPQLELWNDMKACLDLLVWVNVHHDDGWIGWKLDSPRPSRATWTAAKNEYFSNLANDDYGNQFMLGRAAMADFFGGNYRIFDKAVVQELTNTFTVGNLNAIPASFSIVDAYYYFRMGNATFGEEYTQNSVLVNVKIEGNVSNSAVLDVDLSAYVADGGFAWLHLDSLNVGNLSLDGSATDYSLHTPIIVTDPPSHADWPAPIVGITDTWSNMLKAVYYVSGSQRRDLNFIYRISWNVP